MKKIIIVLIAILLLTGCEKSTAAVSSEKDPDMRPPELTLAVGENSFIAQLGSYTWSTYNEDGTSTGVASSSPGPIELAMRQKQIVGVKPQEPIKLNFAVKPIKYEVRIFNGSTSVDQKAEDGEVIAPRKRGLVIYEVLAYWKEGTALYVFKVKVK